MKCHICGNSSGYYPLCSACFKLRDRGDVDKCPKCESWYLVRNDCPCTKRGFFTKLFSAPEKQGPPAQKLKHCEVCGDICGVVNRFCDRCQWNYSNGKLNMCNNCGMWFEIIKGCACSKKQGFFSRLFG